MRIAPFAALLSRLVASETPHDRALEALDVLQRDYYHPSYGLWDCAVYLPEVEGAQGDTGSWWNCANSLEALLNTVDYSQNTTYKKLAAKAWTDQTIQYPIHKSTEGIDDMEWWGLAWARAHEVAGDKDYLKRAKGYFDEAKKYWDETACGGGVWWDRDRSYKNAITNELFITLASRLHALTGDDEYLTWAKKAWQWFEGSSLINEDGLVNDGLDSNGCKNNGGETWTYNQGVVFSGLLHLYDVDKDTAYLDAACRIADAVLTKKTDLNGILRESCETGCNHDGRQFKGIFIRYLAYLAAGLPESHSEQRARYAAFVSANAAIAWSHRTAAGQFTESWGETSDKVDGISHSSGLDLMNADLLLNAESSIAMV